MTLLPRRVAASTIRLVATALAVSAGIASVAGCGGGDGTTPLPSVELVRLDGGGPVDLAAIGGPAVVNVWATNCPPCVREMPALQSVADERPDLNFVGVNIAEPRDQVQRFVDEYEVSYLQLLDPEGFASEALRVDSMPTTFLVDEQGDIVKRHRGEITADQLRNDLADLL